MVRAERRKNSVAVTIICESLEKIAESGIEPATPVLMSFTLPSELRGLSDNPTDVGTAD